MKKFLSILFTLFLFFICSNSKALAENIKFVQITDSHLTVESEFSQKVLESAIEDINAQPDVEFVVFTGDNIGNPTQENLRAFVKIVRKLNVPYYIVLGNHDVYKSKEMSKDDYFAILRERNPFYLQRNPNYVFKKKGFVFITVNGAKEIIPGSVGYYRQSTLDWLNNQLNKYEDKQVIIFQHFPVEYPEGSEARLKSLKTYRVEDYREMLAEHKNILAIVSGHFHTNSEVMKDGVYHISSPSLIGLPYSYKIIDIITTKEFSPIIYTQLREFKVKE